MTDHYRIETLVAFARQLFKAAGCDDEKAATLAEYLVEGDAIGHTTHGLAQAANYLSELEAGAMRATGEPDVIADRKAAITWDGRALPGVWLTVRAIDLGVQRARDYGLCGIAIRNSHHTACLATFLKRATDHGMMVTIANSDPSDAAVAPYGGRTGLFSPNPFAVGIPTSGDPILIDMSASITTNGMTSRLAREGKKFPGQWAVDANGAPTDDPRVMSAEKRGALLLSGGLDHGHKGFGLTLMIEALTQGLSAYGRADKPTNWGCSAFIQVIDPAAFGGLDPFTRQTSFTAQAIRNTAPAQGFDAVRLPGQLSHAGRRAAEKDGLALYPTILASLKPWAEKYAILLPVPL